MYESFLLRISHRTNAHIYAAEACFLTYPRKIVSSKAYEHINLCLNSNFRCYTYVYYINHSIFWLTSCKWLFCSRIILIITRRPILSSFMERVKRIWYLSPMRAAKVQASLRIRAVSPEPPLLAHTSSESRGTFRQKARSLAHLNWWACAVKGCHDGMLEDTNSHDGALIMKKEGISTMTKRGRELILFL